MADEDRKTLALISQLFGFSAFIAIGRLLLVGAILYEVMSFQGDYLHLLSARSNPAVSLEMGMILLGAFMTAFVLLPITGTCLNIAIGLCISAWVNNRAVAAILQMLLVGLRFLTAGLFFYYSWQFVYGGMVLEPASALGLLSFGAAFGDWGLILSQLSVAGELWRTVPFSIFVGLALLLWVIVQALLTQGFLKLAVQAAEVRE